MNKLDIDINNHENIDLLIESMRTADNNFSEIANALKPYYQDIDTYDEKAINKFIKDKSILSNIKDILDSIDDWNEISIDAALKEYQSLNELSVPAVNQPIRIALTGSTKSPSLGLTLVIFGKNKSIERIDKLLNTF